MSWWQSLVGDKAAVPAHAPSPDAQRELVLYKYDSCPYCMRVMRAVERLGVDVEYADVMRDREAGQRHRATTGRSTVPCLYIDGQPLFESADIVAWLEAYAARAA